MEETRNRLRPIKTRHVAKEQSPCHNSAPGSLPTADNTPNRGLLHVLHSWGGGTTRWTEDFARHTSEQRNFILYSVSDRNVFGRTLELVDPTHPDRPLAIWELTTPIRSTATTHPEYGAILSDILTGLAVKTVIVSSLIGHSLEALTTGLPTLRVLHDLYPYCPAMFGYFGEPCTQCNQERLTTCLQSNPQNECRHNSVTEDWLAMRRAYAAAILKPEVRLAAPTRTVRDRLYRLYPEITGKACHIIAHGIDPDRMRCAAPEANCNLAERQENSSLPPTEEDWEKNTHRDNPRKLRIVVPGRLEPHKGLQLLRDALPQLAKQAEFLLLGCGMFGQFFADVDNVATIVPDYNFNELDSLVQDFAPDCALLLSILPETFSYTLSEMSALGIPSLATNLGAFAERIHHGIDGFLYEPNVQDLTRLVASLARDRTPLTDVAHHLSARPVRHARDMVRDYQALLPTPNRSTTQGPRGWLALGIESAQARYHLKYTALEQETIRQATELAETRRRLDEVEQALAHHQARANALEQEQDALRHSNSWRITAPLRAITIAFRALRARLSPNSLISAKQDSPSPLRKGKGTPPQHPTGDTFSSSSDTDKRGSI